MGKEIYTDVLYRLDLPKFDNIKVDYNENEKITLSELSWRIVADFEEKVNKYTIQQLYNFALLKGWTTAIVIDETQFEKFIKECLPKWQEKERKNNDK